MTFALRHAAPLALFLLAGSHSHLLHLLLSFGLIGVFLVSIVDSSFVPLPIPGVTDIMVVLFAAQHADPVLLVLAATAGSALGGYLSYKVGHAGGMAFLEKRIPSRIFKQVTGWMESHAILAIAVPALLPPPMPLSFFVLAAGALNMTLRKFMWSFSVSRLIRHTIAAALGIFYGKQVLAVWNVVMSRYGTPILIVLWTGILGACAFAFWKLWQTSHQVGLRGKAAGSKA